MRAVACAEVEEDGLDVRLDGLDVDAQSSGDLLVREALRHELEHLDVPCGERLGRDDGRRRSRPVVGLWPRLTKLSRALEQLRVDQSVRESDGFFSVSATRGFSWSRIKR